MFAGFDRSVLQVKPGLLMDDDTIEEALAAFAPGMPSKEVFLRPLPLDGACRTWSRCSADCGYRGGPLPGASELIGVKVLPTARSPSSRRSSCPTLCSTGWWPSG